MSKRTEVYMPVCHHKWQNLSALASEDDLSLHWLHVLLSLKCFQISIFPVPPNSVSIPLSLRHLI